MFVCCLLSVVVLVLVVLVVLVFLVVLVPVLISGCWLLVVGCWLLLHIVFSGVLMLVFVVCWLLHVGLVASCKRGHSMS